MHMTQSKHVSGSEVIIIWAKLQKALWVKSVANEIQILSGEIYQDWN